MSDRVLVLNEGKVVETGTADEVFFAPTQPYTRALLAALPKLEPRAERSAAPGPSPADTVEVSA
jgi:peptide/nickel transport system ATP-binding protein